jgi:hypothetical protein
MFNEVVAGTSLNYEYYDGTEASAGDEIRIRIRKRGQETVTLSTIVTALGGSFLPSQETDIHCSGATPTDYTVDFVNLKIRATGARANFTLQELADIICLEQATVDGIRLAEFANITGLVTLSPGVDNGITVDLLGWQVSWAAGSVPQASITDGNLVGGLAGDPVEDVVGGPQVTINLSAAATAVTVNVPTAVEVATAVWAAISESSQAYGKQFRDMRAVLLGKTTGGGTVSEEFLAADGTTTRVTSTNDGQNRTAVSVPGA